MTWKSAEETSYVVEQMYDKERLSTAFAISSFYDSAWYPDDYKVSEEIADLIVLSEHGMSVTENLPNKSYYDKYDLLFSAFRIFYWRDILIDVEKTNLSRLQEILSEDIKNKKIYLADVTGRELYDTFNDSASQNRVESLDPEEATKVIRSSHQGIFQMKDMISGPLGILISSHQRYLPPTIEVPLWHCEDTGCNAIHTVKLRSFPVKSLHVKGELWRHLSSNWTDRSHWRRTLAMISRSDLSESGEFYDVVQIIGDSIFAKERTQLLSHAISSSLGAYLRSAISSNMGKEISYGSPDEVASRLSEGEQLQILCLLSNRDLAALVDSCVYNSKIQIPFGEVRNAKMVPPKVYNEDKGTQPSIFGTRLEVSDPVLKLTSSIWRAYEDRNMLDELGWKIQMSYGKSTRTDLMDFIRQKGPMRSVNDLILSSMPVTIGIAKEFNIELEALNRQSNNQMVEFLLWKIGFNPPYYEDEYARFRTRLQQFNDTVLRISSIKNEDDRETIRSVGVNLFVSVEHVLEEMVSFNVWLLSSDHFLETKFKYSAVASYVSVAENLGESIDINGNLLIWNKNGGNTLGTIVAYLEKSVKWMQGLLNQNHDDILRPSDEMPHFSDDTDLIFPFRHKKLWGDLDLVELEKYISAYQSIVSQISQSNLASIRNGLDHKREPEKFPSLDAMLACGRRLTEAFDIADNGRYIPKVFWLYERRLDRFGTKEYSMQDYMNRQIILRGPASSSGLRKVGFSYPIIIAPGNLLGLPNSEMIFIRSTPTVYSKYWEGYPRRLTPAFKTAT